MNTAAAPVVPEVGMGLTEHGYSDSHAYTVVKVSKSGKTCWATRDKATLLNGVNSGEPDALKFEPGGFCGHTSGTQRYSYESDMDGHPFRFSLTKRGWRLAGTSQQAGGGVTMGVRHEHYDFNF
jgi:hypothetical protein